MERKDRRITKKTIKNIENKETMNTSKFKISYKVLKKPGNFTLVLAIMYIMLIILSVIGRISTLKYTSTTEVTFGAIMSEFTMPIIVAALLIVTTIVYYKNKLYGATLEISVGLSMIIDVLISVFTSGFDMIALLLTLIIPNILIIHSIITFKKIKSENKSA